MTDTEKKLEVLQDDVRRIAMRLRLEIVKATVAADKSGDGWTHEKQHQQTLEIALLWINELMRTHGIKL